MRGGMEYLGWGTDRYMIAALYDALNANTVATGHFKKRPKLDPFPTPDKKKSSSGKNQIKAKDAKDLHRQFKMLEGAHVLGS